MPEDRPPHAGPRRALRPPQDDGARAPQPAPPKPLRAAWAGPCARSACPAFGRDKGVRTTIPAKDGKHAGDLFDRDFTAPAPNRVWVTDFTYVRTWSPVWVYVAFIVDVFSQRIVARHASTSKATDLVMTPSRSKASGPRSHPSAMPTTTR